MKNDFVSRVQQSAQGKVERFGNTHAYQDFRLRIVGNVMPLVEIASNRLAKLDQTEIRCVTGFSFLQCENRSFSNPPGRYIIWLADTERNDASHRLDDLKEISNARTGDAADMAGGVTTYSPTSDA